MLKKVGLESILDFHGAKSQIILPRFLEEEKKFDVAFIDGNHLCDYVFLDLFYLGQLVKPGGVIFMDDYDLPGIRKAATFYVKNLGWEIEEVGSEGDREWLVLRTSVSEDKRKYDYFVDF